ncbi:restriction endonuclease subunit S [Symbiobacterium thermophilum]|uniref:Type I restriction modification DNA specificity domain-containing protein n=1 Tax=Symbiobacterium thermophilum TaxID=2734 RepID=A0A953IAU8_SYMTR|nr:restriction endonuclease subunit S [Symbiobacterium thermophilum]MBY6277653.1 hypothetical protein [Symbiobacterium thermophilum]
MRKWLRRPLCELAEFERELIQPDEIPPGTIYVGLEHITSNGTLVGARPIESHTLASTKFRFSNRHILYGKLRPYLAKIACPEFSGVCSTDILPILPGPEIDRRFLFHYLRWPKIVRYAASKAVGANLPRLSTSVLGSVQIPVPPLDEQRLIAEMLDRAEALINSRRKSLTTLDGLIRTLFVDSFGDIAINTRRWPTIRLQELLTAPPRNGVSPAKGGTANYNVLTLSAITGREFDVTAVKNGSFVSIPGPQYMVDENDFLICRGNGNLDLVGRGHFPPYSMPGVIFPDTMIAIRLSADLVDKVFFEQMWNSPLVRRQIELLARTTNGTYKINQTMLADITLVVPPIELQRKFGEQVSTIQQLKSKYRTSLVQFEALYASLQHRAFKGEL